MGLSGHVFLAGHPAAIAGVVAVVIGAPLAAGGASFLGAAFALGLLAAQFVAPLVGLVVALVAFAPGLFIALLAATSFDRMVKAMGPKAWARLHWWGVWIVALSFIFTNGKRIPVSGWYALPVALVVAVIVLRVVAGRKQRRAAALA